VKLELSSEQSGVRLQMKLGVSSEQSWTTPSPAKLKIKLLAKLIVSLQRADGSFMRS